MMYQRIACVILLLLPICLPAQEVQVRIDSEDASWQYRGAVRSAAETMAGAEANLAEALSNYTAPAFPMTHFSAEAMDNSHAIHWTSGTPRQGFRLYVQRSENGKTWHEIGMINGSPAMKPLEDWAFADERPLDGPNYYRLRQVTVDGNSVVSDPIVVEHCPGGHHTTALFPHPGIFGTQIQLTLSTPQPVLIRLLNADDQEIGVIFQEEATVGIHKVEVDVTALEAGEYVCEIEVGGQVTRRQIVR